MCTCNISPCECEAPKPTTFDVFLEEFDRFMSCLRWDIKDSAKRQEMFEALIAKLGKNPDYEKVAIALSAIKVKWKMAEAKAEEAEDAAEDTIMGSNLLEDL